MLLSANYWLNLMNTRNEQSKEIISNITFNKTTFNPDTDLCCPECKEPELNPETGLLNFRGFKVMDDDGYWWSHCLTCDEWF
jgi:hypothetical protein